MLGKFRRYIPSFAVGWYHLALVLAGAFLYGLPSKKLVVIGVTGTNGKSTVVEMCDLILREAGFRVASLSSIRFRIGDKEWKNDLKMTMPGRFRLQKFLQDAVRAGCRYVILEVTSEGIKQHRHRFIDFDAAVLTNLTPEHIESHGNFEKYREAKGELFAALKAQSTEHKTQIKHKTQNTKPKLKKTSVVNLDDPNAEYFLRFPANEKYGFRIMKHELRITNKEYKIIEAENIKIGASGASFIIHNSLFKIPLLGEFNVYNALAAICVGLSQGIDLETIKKALEKIRGVPGRMEVVAREPFTVVVDYAHTPDSLRKVYETLRKESPKSETLPPETDPPRAENSKLICVLGAAGGGRDKWKRPEMGKIAAEYCDEIILTNEDPYNEKPLQILDDIERGFSQIPNSKFQIPKYEKVLDRREAISSALKTARAGDTVVITGKGSEPWMCVAGGKKISWDDRQIVKEELKKLKIPPENMNKQYEILEHTGDARIRVFGRTKEELFLNATRGMMRLLKPQITNYKSQITKRAIHISSSDINALLVDFLSEVNYLAQTEREVYDEVKFIKFIDTKLEAEIFGKKVQEFGEEIKAVTHHGLEINQNPEGVWEAAIIFDI